MLSDGALQDILSKPAEQHPRQPVFQILAIKKIQVKGYNGARNDRYRIVLSDGIFLYSSAMLGIQLNPLVISKEIEVKAVVQLDEYVCNTIQESRIVLIMLEVTVIKPGSEVSGRIGCPKIIFSEGFSSDHHPQQNENPELPSYEMMSLPIGKCIVINNEQFHDVAYNRDGAKHDEKRLKDLFEELGFVVDIRRNLTRDEINNTSKDVAAEDHSNFDVVVFIIMSHGGSRDAVCGVDGRHAYVEDVMSEFKAMKCPSLRNKPKLFFIQCCRGSSTEFVSPAYQHCDTLVPNHDSTLVRSVCPQEADFLLAFAASPGYFSYRYPDGSVFIQVLVDVIRKHHQHSHLIEMLSEVTRQVVDRGTTCTADDKMPRVQVPAYSNTLRAKLYLKAITC